MSVAWIGNQAVTLIDAVQQAATLLVKSRCPVFSIDSDVHGTRGAIALAERVGATYDHVTGADLASEVALYTDHGGFFTTPLETRRRADLIVIVGELPSAHHALVLSWTSATPDLPSPGQRHWFHLRGNEQPAGSETSNFVEQSLKAEIVTSPDLSLGGVIAVVRAALAGRKTSLTVAGIDGFIAALSNARFPVFVFSGNPLDPSSLVMLQGLVADVNQTRRASSLFLPDCDHAWGTVLTSLWMTGFPPRTRFAAQGPIYDPLLCDIARMIADGEADLHLWLSERDDAPQAAQGRLPTIALARTGQAVAGAAVTICVGTAGIDHDGVTYSSRTGTFTAVSATARSDLPPPSHIMRQLLEALPDREGLPC